MRIELEPSQDLENGGAQRRKGRGGFMADVREAPMRIGTEDPWALTELAKAGGSGGAQPPQPRGGFGGVPPI